LHRSGTYVEWMRQLFKEEGQPQDLVYLALIESGFSNHAYSRAKAAGTWQFIPSTGRHYGLDQNSWLDERRDPEKATRAAAQYLKKLYGDFGDWYLAMAAYNAGEGRIAGAIRKCGCRDFWKLTAPGTRYLKPETKDYVPKFLAAAIIAKNPARYGFSDVAYQELLAYEAVAVDGHLDLNVAAELVGVDFATIKGLNPELNRMVTPPRQYSLKIPPGTKEKFELAYADLPPEKRVNTITHRVRRGDTVIKLSRRYGVPKADIIAANGLNPKRPLLKTGAYITVPKAGVVIASNSAVASEQTTHVYKVRRGDSLSKVARRFGVSQSQIKAQNHLRKNTIRIGQRLKITTGSSLKGEDLLAYNKKPGKVRQNGVEWLIRREQKTNGDAVEATDAANEVTAEPVMIENEVKEAAAGAPQKLEETDLMPVAEQVAENEEVTPPKPVASVTYRVKKGDNLAKIAKRHGVSIASLKHLNNIKNVRRLKVGQKLILEEPQHTANPF
ncbi:MAG: LysM peptidoglycan-binding domain-containing protein, partial [bacterium]|nr:LysM peptidoglycan-binding domain-containing protein [bacterium]